MAQEPRFEEGPAETEYADQTDEHFREKKGDRLALLVLPWGPLSLISDLHSSDTPPLSFLPTTSEGGFAHPFSSWAATDIIVKKTKAVQPSSCTLSNE